MWTFAQKPKTAQQNTSTKSTLSGRAHFVQSREVNSILHLQRAIGNQAVQRLLQSNIEELRPGLATTASMRFRHDFRRIPVVSSSAVQTQPTLTVSTPRDRYEQEADRIAEQVMSLRQPRQSHQKDVILHKTASIQSSAGNNSSAGNALTTQPREFFEPRFGFDFSNVRVHTDRLASESARSIGARAYTVGEHISFAATEYQPSTREGRQLPAHELAHVIQQNRSPLPNRPHALSATLSRVSSSETHVQRDVRGARERLRELERRRAAGEAVTEREQRAGEQEALSSGQEALDVASDAVGSEIANVQTRILGQISVIESARARGYNQAITELNARGLDNDADYTAFGVAMGGNLLWALSGIVPMLPTAAFAIRGLGPFFQAACRSRDVWTATVGVVGAMTAQFSAGLPSGTSSADVKSAMIRRLTTANSKLCNHLRRRFYILLTDAIAHATPEASTDAQTYAAELEVGLSHALYGDIYAKRLNDGDLVSASAVQEDARNQLLRQYVVGSSAIDTHLVGRNDIGATRSASEANVVDDAIALLGGQNALRLEPFELVANQARTSAQDLGVTLRDFDTQGLGRILSQGEDAFIPATQWDSRVVFTGSPSRWMNPFHTSSIVECHPRISNEPYMQRRHIRSIDGVTLRTSQMTSMVDSRGTRIWSMNAVWFQAHGGPDDTSGFIQVTDIPDTFFIKYQIQD